MLLPRAVLTAFFPMSSFNLNIGGRVAHIERRRGQGLFLALSTHPND